MGDIAQSINIKKMLLYILKRLWLIIICAGIGFAGMFYYENNYTYDTYTASATVYVLNGNPNLINYQYTNVSDLNSAVQLLDTYMVVIKSSKVMGVVAERLTADYPGITAKYIASTLSMGSVSETGVLRIRSTTQNAQLSADICNAVLDVAPAEIIRVVSAGDIQIIDYAEVPLVPDIRSPLKKGLFGALVGGFLITALLVMRFLLNRKVTDKESLIDHYTPPVLSCIKRKKTKKGTESYLINKSSSMDQVESYAKLRMNLLYTLVGKENKIVVISSAVSGEGKSTITANLAVSCAMSGKKVLLVDADMRRACQKVNFGYDENCPGLSEALIENGNWWDSVLVTEWEGLHLLPAGHLPPNPAELLSLPQTEILLRELQQQFDLILIDTPPIDVVSDPLVLSPHVAGCVLVVRQNYSDHREIKKALISMEMTGMNVLGFIFYGEKLEEERYYGNKYYRRYYNDHNNLQKRK